MLACCWLPNWSGQIYIWNLYTQHNNKDEWDCSFRKYTSHFIWKGCVWEGVGDWTELQHIDPHSIGRNRVSFPFSWGPTLLGAGFLYRILSPTGLVSKLTDLQNCTCSIGGLTLLGAGFLYRILSPTNWLPVFPELYNSSRPPSSCGRHNCTHSTHPRSRL